MSQSVEDLRIRVKQLEADLETSRYVKRDLQEKLDVRHQKMKEAELHIKTLELVEANLREQISSLKLRLNCLKANRT